MTLEAPIWEECAECKRIIFSNPAMSGTVLSKDTLPELRAMIQEFVRDFHDNGHSKEKK